MGFIDDLTGRKYGRLTVIGYYDTVHRMSRWRCNCECGNECIAYGNHLKTGHKRSCGCIASEYRKNKPETIRRAMEANTTHGGTKDRLFKIWTSMRNRCTNPRNPAYKWYGKKGVSVCQEWDNYEAFKEWAYKNGYDDSARMHECSIDRIDPNGNYCPENCRWADIQTQATNKTNVTIYTHNGEKGTISYFARKYGLKVDTVRWRVKKLNWSIEKALTTGLWKKA